LQVVSPSVSRPNRPASTAALSVSLAGLKREGKIVQSLTLCCLQALMIRSQRSRVISSGFSTTTCLPASAAATAGSMWAPLGVVMMTTFTSGRPRTWASSVAASQRRSSSWIIFWALAALRLTEEEVDHWGMHVPFFLLRATAPRSKKGPRNLRRAYAGLLRDVAGHNPYQGGRGCQLTGRKGKQTLEPMLRPEWRTDAVTAIAKGIYELRDFAAMPILADALQDAGCEQPDLLAHCRDTRNPHVRGCWVVDLVLGRA
jgi:hypothetical protein